MIRRFARPYAKAMMDIVKSPQEGRKLHDELLGFERARSSSRELAALFRSIAPPRGWNGLRYWFLATKPVYTRFFTVTIP